MSLISTTQCIRKSSSFDDLITEMTLWHGWSSTRTKAQVLSTARNMFRWFSANGCHDAASITLDDIRAYYMHRTQEVTYPKSARYTMKLAFEYLRRANVTSVDPSSVFRLKAPRKSKILPAMPGDDIAKILDAIDRSTDVGKRDYAFILAGATTGLRKSDIAMLRLRDIDWRAGTISVTQRKTSQAISVPLTRGLGEALEDYILNGRKKSDSERIFLTADGSRPLSTNALSGGFGRYCGKAGVKRSPRDGLSFHSLRRSVGKRLCAAGVPMPTIAQVLGHRAMESSEQYIKLECDTLSNCGLSFAIVGNGGLKWK